MTTEAAGFDPEAGFGIPGEDRDGLGAAEADAAYRWAAGAVAGKNVLVAGCGRGHGAQILVEAGAKSVLGVDPEPRAVEIAERLYGERARFITAEPVALPLAARSYDVVVSFGSLEGTLDPESTLAEFRRILAEDGLLLIALPLSGFAEDVPAGARGRGAARWREALERDFGAVRTYRRRVALAATVAPEAPAAEIDQSVWLEGDPAEDRSVLALAGRDPLPELQSVASLVSFRDLRAQHETLEAWEERARRAEADGSAKHWELVASREAQRRLRVRLHKLEHRPFRVISRILRGKPAKLGPGPPIRASELNPQRWD